LDVLVVGGGGREHALVWALQRSASVGSVYCAPGNAGIARHTTCWPIQAGDLAGLAHAAQEHSVDLVVVGPEIPLAAGIAETLEAIGIPCFGPRKPAAILEGSKAFSKAFMRRHDIPTADFEVFDESAAALDFARQPPWGFPIVVKADGLAAGKGVLICPDANSASAAVNAAMQEGTFGDAGNVVVIEQFLTGTEVTLMALSDGQRVVPLLPSQDHKQALDGDRGANTGGMGAYAPAESLISAAIADELSQGVLQATIDAMAAEDRPFAGVLYAGLMFTDEGPMVLEYNCRFGDPEAQAVLPLLREDVGELFAGIAAGRLPNRPLRWSEQHAACVILAAEGYPGPYRRGDPITGLETLAGRDDVMVFHAGTAQEAGELVTTGGRVLGVSALGDSLSAALDAAYNAIDLIQFDGMHYRRDIGRRTRSPT